MGIGEWVTGNGEKKQAAESRFELPIPPACTRSITNYPSTITSYQLPINC
jgi:hypothetical protein